MFFKKKAPAILVVDDEPLVLMLAMDIFDDLGFRAVSAPDADEALNVMEERDDIGAIFTDVQMPGSMDGLQLAQKVKARWPLVKILITSGQDPSRLALPPAGSAFLRKPYDRAAVKNSLREIWS